MSIALNTDGSLLEIAAIDSTIISLRPALRPLWKATWKSGASIKLSVVYNVVHGCTMDLSLCQGTKHDTKAIKPVGPWVKDMLVLMDLGYWALRTFKAINKHGGFFISCLKSGKIVRIVSDNMPAGPESMELVGRDLCEVCTRLRRRQLDLEVVVGGGNSGVPMRLVGAKHPEAANLDADQMGVRAVMELYRLCWQMRLLFKCMRSVAQIDQMPSADPNIVHTLVWASILRVALGELVCLLARQKARMVRRTLCSLRAQLAWR